MRQIITRRGLPSVSLRLLRVCNVSTSVPPTKLSFQVNRFSASRLWWPAGHAKPDSRRWMSASASNEDGETNKNDEDANVPTMESKLRKLYMRVHPDLFNSLPVAKKANERSFQNLSNFLETLKQSEFQASNETFVLEFYLRPREHTGQLKMEDLEHFKMTVQGGGSEFEKQMELGKLFEKCGLGADFKMKNKSAFRTASDLERFLAQVGEEAAMNKMRMDSQWRDIIVHQHVLRQDKGVRISFMCAEHDSPDLQLATLQKLHSSEFEGALEDLAVELRQVVIGHCNGLDAEGRLMLHPASSVAEWLQHLRSVDWAASYSRKASVRALREQEKAAARRLGLTFVHARQDIEHESAYKALLDALARSSARPHSTRESAHRLHFHGGRGAGGASASGGAGGGAWGHGEWERSKAGGVATRDGAGGQAVLLVQREVSAAEEGVAMLRQGCGIDEAKGTLLAAVDCAAEDIVGVVAEHAASAAQIRQQFERKREHISELLAQARAVLGAAGIEVDWEEGVSEEEAAVCLEKMMAGASSNTSMGGLAKHTAGMHILIGNQYQLRQDGVVVVPFDFNK